VHEWDLKHDPEVFYLSRITYNITYNNYRDCNFDVPIAVTRLLRQSLLSVTYTLRLKQRDAESYNNVYTYL